VTPSTQICIWRAMMDRLPTKVNLSRRSVQLDNLVCPICKRLEETTLYSVCSGIGGMGWLWEMGRIGFWWAWVYFYTLLSFLFNDVKQK